MIKVKRPVILKVILTEQVRQALQAEYQGYISQYQLEIEQLQFQNKKLIADAAKKGPEAQKIVHERLQKEEKARRDKISQYNEMLAQLAMLPDGREIVHSQLETEVEVKVGDDWGKLVGKSEIVVKDGIIVEIRN